jgi:drug/metabolite transporter (DMT)-like permease
MTTTSSRSADRTRGVLWAIAACLCWGGAFLAPLVLIGYSAIEITAGRFAGAGLFSLNMLLVAAVRGGLSGIGAPRLWLVAFGLALIGNFIYFAAITAGVQRANAAIVTLIIGLLPIAIPLVATLQNGTFSARRMALPSALIIAGLVAVHFGAHRDSAGAERPYDWLYASGLMLAGLGLVSWTAFAILNAKAMAARPQLSSALWSSLQGVVLLPIVLPILALMIMAGATHGGSAGRASLETFLAVSLTLGVVTSWMAIWCWNQASKLLPQEMAGQLLVFETVASLFYVYLWFGTWPPLLVVAGTALLLGGVSIGLKSLSSRY